MNSDLRARLRAKAASRPRPELPPIVGEIAARARALIAETGLTLSDVMYYVTRLRDQERLDEEGFLKVEAAVKTLVEEFSEHGMTEALAAGELSFHASIAYRREQYRL